MAEKKYYCFCGSNCRYETLNREQILTAITNAVKNGTVGDVNSGFITTIKTINGVPLKFFVGTRADYDKLSADDKNNTYAIITNEDTTTQFLEALGDLEAKVKSIEGNVISNMKALVDGDVTVAYAVASEFAQKDERNNIIHEHYATKEESARVVSVRADIKNPYTNEPALVGALPKNKTIYDVCAVVFTILGTTLSGVAHADSVQEENYVNIACSGIGAGVSGVGSGTVKHLMSFETASARISQEDGKIYFCLSSYCKASTTPVEVSKANPTSSTDIETATFYTENGLLIYNGTISVTVYFK